MVFRVLKGRYITLQWNITEDMNIDEFDSEPRPPDDVSELLYMPLPPDLPAINKDLLILMAAYYGDVDRYVRLRRPVMIDKELPCVLRGIYHNTFFAKWWSLQQSTPLKDVWKKPSIQRAINARFIMSNDLSRITPSTPNEHLPFCIWYPNLAEPETYRELARREPRMVLRVARACIIANYQEVYEGLGESKPTEDLLCEAEQRPSTFYTDDLNRRAELHGGFVLVGQASLWKEITFIELARLFNTTLSGVITPDDIPTDDQDMHGGYAADVGSILLNVCAPESVKKGRKHMPLDEVYKNPDLEQQPEMLDDLPYRLYLKYALRHNLESQQS